MKPKFRRKVLKNRMVVLFEKRALPTVSVAFAVKHGSINESVSEKGISHFIEHLLYKGTSTRNSRQIAIEIERKGGELNGFTSETTTAFHCKMPSKHLKTALEVLGDLVKNPKFDPAEIEKERQVIFEEMKLYRDNPQYYVFQEIQKNLYKGHFKIPVIGTLKSMNSITREKLIKKFREVYKPNNMILCVVGDADFKDVVKFAKKNFGKEKARVTKKKVEKQNKSKIEKRKGIDQANLVFAYHVPRLNNKKSYAAFVLNVLMAVGMSSRLFNEIREKRNLAYVVKGSSEINKDFAYNSIYVGAKKENVNKIKKIILREFEKVSKELDDSELEQVKEQIIGNYQIAIEDSHIQMQNLIAYEINGNAKKAYEFEKNIRSVKLKDVKKLAKNPIKNHSFFALVPG